MANRAYLYTATNDLKIMRDVSENTSDVPLIYKILLGVNTEKQLSQIWNYEETIAISGDFELGLNKLLAFYEYLKTQVGIDSDKITKYIEDTNTFFSNQEERKLNIFFMEGGEVYDLIATEDYTITKENEYQYLTTLQISSHINEILENRPENLFALKEKYQWLTEIEENLDVLEPYWTHVTYFSFNKSGVEEA